MKQEKTITGKQVWKGFWYTMMAIMGVLSLFNPFHILPLLFCYLFADSVNN